MHHSAKLGIAAGLLALAACHKPRETPEAAPAGPRPDPKDIPANVDKIAHDVLADTGVPSAVVAAVSEGKIVYAHAYGDAKLEPKTPATLQMRYSIGSISKQFTAAAVLLLAEEGKLSLDDHVSKYIPALTRGDDITIRQILSHTSGYPDYEPQDYFVPEWAKPITAQQIIDRWAKVPLEFEPGSKWQYSNTNFVIAGMICEQVAGQPLFDFLGDRVFKKLGMTSVTDSDKTKLTEPDPQGYFRRALAPLHPAPHEGPGWMFAAGELAMTVEDLARWDISVIQQSVMSPASYHAFETEILLTSGAGTRYALGTNVGLTSGHRELQHGGEVSGFVSSNHILPDDKIAIAVLTNQDAAGAADRIATQVRDVLLRAASAPSLESDRRIHQTLDDLTAGKIDRASLTANANSYFTDDAIKEIAASLAPLGAAQSVEQTSSNKRGGMTTRRYRVKYAKKSLAISVYETGDGKLEQFLLEDDH